MARPEMLAEMLEMLAEMLVSWSCTVSVSIPVPYRSNGSLYQRTLPKNPHPQPSTLQLSFHKKQPPQPNHPIPDPRQPGGGFNMFEVNGLIKEKTVALLAVLAEGAEVNSRDDSGKTPLHAAARQGHQEVVTLLIANGADVNAKTEKGETAISLANKKGHTEIVELLRKHGPE